METLKGQFAELNFHWRDRRVNKWIDFQFQIEKERTHYSADTFTSRYTLFKLTNKYFSWVEFIWRALEEWKVTRAELILKFWRKKRKRRWTDHSHGPGPSFSKCLFSQTFLRLIWLTESESVHLVADTFATTKCRQEIVAHWTRQIAKRLSSVTPCLLSCIWRLWHFPPGHSWSFTIH